MKTLEQVKKDKNYLTCKKGYPMNPEGFSYQFLFRRLKQEYNELLEDLQVNAIELYTDSSKEILISELADISNFLDYIATKIIINYPTLYDIKKKENE